MISGVPSEEFNKGCSNRIGVFVVKLDPREREVLSKLRGEPGPPCLFCGSPRVFYYDPPPHLQAARVTGETKEGVMIMDPMPAHLIALRCIECEVTVYTPKE